MQMQTFKSIRVVQAFQIVAIENGKLQNDVGEWIKPVAEDFFQRHSPHVGAWFVVYPDGYQSICPDESFREGYREIGDMVQGSDTDLEVFTNATDGDVIAVSGEAGEISLAEGGSKDESVAVAACVSSGAPVASSTFPVLGGDVPMANAGLADQTRQGLIAGGFLTVGVFREAVIQKLTDGGIIVDLPGVSDENAAEIEEKLLNDRGPGNYLTGESHEAASSE